MIPAACPATQINGFLGSQQRQGGVQAAKRWRHIFISLAKTRGWRWNITIRPLTRTEVGLK